jgi:hypothetical protein
MLLSLTALALLALAAPTASATTGGCFVPEFACDIYTSFYFEDAVDLSSDPKICERQCREFRDACLKVCKQTSECLEVAATGFSRGENLECNELEGSAKSDCKSDVNEGISSFHEFLSGQRQDCKDCCEATYQDCLDECTDV